MTATYVSELTGAEKEAVASLQNALEKLGASGRTRAVAHVEAALKCLQDPRESILPSELNSANDG